MEMPRRFSIYAEFIANALIAPALLLAGVGRRRALRVAPRRRTDSAAAHHWRASCQAPRGYACKLLIAPVAQSLAQKLRLDSERLTHRLEREGALSAFANQPLLSLAEQTLAR